MTLKARLDRLEEQVGSAGLAEGGCCPHCPAAGAVVVYDAPVPELPPGLCCQSCGRPVEVVIYVPDNGRGDPIQQ
jgi:hypothetical protein